MMKKLYCAILVLTITGCASTPNMPTRNTVFKKPVSKVKQATKSQAKKIISSNQALSLEEMLLTVEKKASKQGRKVLKTGRKMTLAKSEIIQGGSWDYANAVYSRAGFPNQLKQRQTVFKGSKKGSYADVSLIKAGDFLHYINHPSGGIEHSAIFINWVDYERKIALMLSYEDRNSPAQYVPYNLSSVYQIIRPK